MMMTGGRGIGCLGDKFKTIGSCDLFALRDLVAPKEAQGR